MKLFKAKYKWVTDLGRLGYTFDRHWQDKIIKRGYTHIQLDGKVGEVILSPTIFNQQMVTFKPT